MEAARRRSAAGPFGVTSLAFAVLLMACGAGEGGAPAAGPKKAPEAAVVEVARAGAPQLRRVRRLLGRAEAPLAATLSAGVGGALLTVGPREGDAVKAGDVVATLDASLVSPRLKAARAEVARVGAELRLARAELGRVKALTGEGMTAVSPAERERFEARAAALEAGSAGAAAEVEALSAELARHTVSAPFDGAVAVRHLDPGAWAAVGAPILTLVGAGAVEVFVDVPLADAAGLAVGGEVGLAPQDGRGAVALVGVIAGRVPAVDAVTQGVRLRISPAPAPEGVAPLLPGAPVEVVLTEVLSAKDAVKVPNDAVKRGPARAWVYALPEGAPPVVPRRVDVELLGREGDEALVRGEGLKEGVAVITRGNERLRPGQAVQVAAPAPPAASSGGARP